MFLAMARVIAAAVESRRGISTGKVRDVRLKHRVLNPFSAW